MPPGAPPNGAALLAALERGDAEQLALVRAGQEAGVLRIVAVGRQNAIDDVQAEIAALEQGKAAADFRVTCYSGLLTAGLNTAETSNLDLAAHSITAKEVALPIHGLSIMGYLTPSIFGLADGGMQFGDAVNAGAAIAAGTSELLGQMASVAEVVGGQLRRADEWRLQQHLAQYEADQLTQRITAATARLAAVTQDLAAGRQQLADVTRVESLTRTRFTNQELYAWMVGRIATVHVQAFRMAQQLALQAQAAYWFELDRTDAIVALGTWDTLHEGLLAGDGLLLSLEQLRQAHLDHDDRRLEIEKSISLRQAFPLAFADFRWGTATRGPGQLDFVLGQALYDFDYPGHHSRTIKAVSVTVPSVIGPYQDLHMTLVQNTNLVVVEPDEGAVGYAIAQTAAGPQQNPPAAPAPGSVRENWRPSQSIAVSRGVDDAGLFTLDFHDERYLPFEGTGAVSSWTLSLPPETNRLDLDAIADIVLKVRYTARDGGPAFAAKVRRLYAQAGDRFAYLNAVSFTVAQVFGAAWADLFAAPATGGTQTLTFRLPPGAVLPGVTGVTLVGVTMRLETADGDASSTPGAPFLTLRVDDLPATAVGVPVAARTGEVAAADLAALAGALSGGVWTLAFDTTLAPAALLTGGALDPAKLRDLMVVVAYSATPFGSAR